MPRGDRRVDDDVLSSTRAMTDDVYKLGSIIELSARHVGISCLPFHGAEMASRRGPAALSVPSDAIGPLHRPPVEPPFVDTMGKHQSHP